MNLDKQRRIISQVRIFILNDLKKNKFNFGDKVGLLQTLNFTLDDEKKVISVDKNCDKDVETFLLKLRKKKTIEEVFQYYVDKVQYESNMKRTDKIINRLAEGKIEDAFTDELEKLVDFLINKVTKKINYYLDISINDFYMTSNKVILELDMSDIYNTFNIGESEELVNFIKKEGKSMVKTLFNKNGKNFDFEIKED